ncbi:integral membrane protein [Arthrobacter pigmenti]|uniref:Integral membrane protein n=1 Tax=Arthrobacter pigmenti TaxID=271432 RepID=A0A846RPS0_9MICC|nr:integral membrane protein [Arthrobacter pigmenti]
MTTPAHRPAAKKRRFGGTHAQIRSALGFYKVLAYATGVMLLLVVVEMVAKYGFQSEIIAGGSAGALGLVNEAAADAAGGFNLSTAVLIVHGWLYVVYLIADFRLWQFMRWPFSRFVLIALGGVVPLLSFIVEKRIHRRVEEELAAHPEASKRY